MEKIVTKPNKTIEYHKDAVITCNCGAVYQLGSTQKDIKIEICAACHPFFTGTQKYIDSAGRLERFKEKVAVGQKHKAEKTAKLAKNKKKVEDDQDSNS